MPDWGKQAQAGLSGRLPGQNCEHYREWNDDCLINTDHVRQAAQPKLFSVYLIFGLTKIGAGASP